ncbi:MAG TPA: hypothetical protein VF342_07015 [Alphaproteobacteria bacterium]
MSKTKRRKPVKRATDRAGIALPTRRELDFVRLIAGYLRFRLPEDFERDLRYVRTFLDTFAYARSGPVFKSDVQRRCAIARQFAYEGRPLTDYAEKLGVTTEQAALLETFGQQKAQTRWRADDAAGAADVRDAHRATAALEDEAPTEGHESADVGAASPEPDIDELFEDLPDELAPAAQSKPAKSIAA